jgi:predicted MPP superfamily phosphohydrolase
MLTSFLILCVLVFVLVVYMYWEAHSLLVKEQLLYLPEWPEGFEEVRFLFISDLHRRKLPHHIKDQLSKEKIDLVLIGGDITEKSVPFSRVRENVRFLSSLGPSYFVWGNNDYNVDYRKLDILLREEKVTVLANDAVSFESGVDRLWLIGVDDASVNRDQIELAIGEIVEPGYRLLLSHNPIIVEKLNEKDEIKAVLSGHTHGGQICLPFIGPLVKYLGNSLLTKYVSGEYSIKNGKGKLFISNGVGTSGLPLRLLARPEVHLFTIKRARECKLKHYSGTTTSVGKTN